MTVLIRRCIQPLIVIFITIMTAGCSSMFVNERAVSLQDVIFLTEHGLSSEVITKHIEATGSRFDLTTEDLATLKDAGVDDEVIAFMVDRNGPQPPFASEYGRPQIPGLQTFYLPPVYYESYGFIPLYDNYIDYYGTMQYQYHQPLLRREGLIGCFYEASPDAFYGTDFSRRGIVETDPVDRATPENDDESGSNE